MWAVIREITFFDPPIPEAILCPYFQLGHLLFHSLPLHNTLRGLLPDFSVLGTSCWLGVPEEEDLPPVYGHTLSCPASLFFLEWIQPFPTTVFYRFLTNTDTTLSPNMSFPAWSISSPFQSIRDTLSVFTEMSPLAWATPDCMGVPRRHAATWWMSFGASWMGSDSLKLDSDFPWPVSSLVLLYSLRFGRAYSLRVFWKGCLEVSFLSLLKMSWWCRIWSSLLQKCWLMSSVIKKTTAFWFLNLCIKPGFIHLFLYLWIVSLETCRIFLGPMFWNLILRSWCGLSSFTDLNIRVGPFLSGNSVPGSYGISCNVSSLLSGSPIMWV